MKILQQPRRAKSALTLIEMTLVIMMLLAMIGTGFFANKKVDEWKIGRAASETLRQVHTAQRMFLADNPTHPVEDIEEEDVIPYLPGNVAVLPTIESLTGKTLNIKVDVLPPVVVDGSGVTYDPSGDSKDGVWDIAY